MNQLLIKANDIPRLTSLSGNVDVDKLAPNVFTAQVNDVKRVLGEELYTKIVSDYEADTLAAEYKTMYENYIIYMLAYYSVSYYIRFGGYQITNNGISKMTVEGGTAVDMKDMLALSERYKQMGVNFENELNKYLATITIPEYKRTDRKKNKQIIHWY